MTITTTQKIIKIGTSKGVTIPAKQLRELGASNGDEVEVVIRKKSTDGNSDASVAATANDLLERYKQDFTNLAGR